MTKDEEQFGKGSWVYCMEHPRPHITGWCTISNSRKVMLEAANSEEAYKECRHKNLKLFDPEEK